MKQRLSKLALLAIAAAFIVAGFPACSDEEEPDPPAVVLESIQVQTNPTKITYTVGETLDPTGLVVKEVYSDGTTADVAYTDENKDAFAFTGFDTSKVGDVTVTVTYKEKPATFTVSVAANGIDPDKELASIAVKTKPTKAEYKVGDALDPAGLVITATYSDGSTEDIAYNTTNFALTGFDASKPNESVTVTVTYKEKTAEFTVSVAAAGLNPDKELASIAVKTKPTKTAYTVGDALDPAGLVITATYTDETNDPIAYSEANKGDFSFTGFDTSKVGDVTVTVTYKGKTAEFNVSVAEKKGDEEEEPDPTKPTLFETLSAQENNILKEDFATAFTPDTFGAGFGKVGVYGDSGVTVADGAISTGSGKNRKIHVDFGLVKEVVEGCVTLTVGGTQPQADKNLLTFYNGDSALFTLQTGSKAATATTAPVGGTAGTYEIYYKFDLTAKTVSLTVNGKAVLTDSALAVDSVSGYTIESHNGGKGTVAADDIAVCATKGDLATYKTQVKAWLATLVTNSYSEGKGYTVNKADVDAAKSAGDSAIDAAEDIDAVLAAYGNAKTALGQVKSDLAQAKANACDELDAYFPEGKSAESYTGEKADAVNAAKEAGKTAINAATKTDDVETALDEAKKAIDALPDDNVATYTVTVKTNEDTTLDTIENVYKNVASVLDKIKKLAADQNKVIKDGKLYSNKECTAEYDTETELTGDVTVYVILEDKTTTTYVLTPDMISTWTSAKTELTDITKDGVKFQANAGITYDKTVPNDKSATASIKTSGSCQPNNNKNFIKFTTTGSSTVTVDFFSTNTDSRSVGYTAVADKSAVSSSAWTNGAIGGTKKATEAKVVYTETFSIEKAGTYFLGGNNGIYITKITVVVEE